MKLTDVGHLKDDDLQKPDETESLQHSTILTPTESIDLPARSGIKIRVITPALAQIHENVNTIPLLHGGVPVPLTTTLWDVRSRIANSLGIVLDEAMLPVHQECNCTFAQQIKAHGIWETNDCLGHDLSDPTVCVFRCSGREDPMADACALCSLPIAEHHGNDLGLQQFGHPDCTAKVSMRTDAGCHHILHSTCAQNKSWKCPSGCQKCELPPIPS